MRGGFTCQGSIGGEGGNNGGFMILGPGLHSGLVREAVTNREAYVAVWDILVRSVEEVESEVS